LRNRLETIIAEMLEMGIRLPLAKRDFEKAYLRLALEKNEGHRLATAHSLGIHRNTLKNKLVKHRLSATSSNGKGRVRVSGKAQPRGRKG
jgi:DNA-binding NtrC family response regulator